MRCVSLCHRRNFSPFQENHAHSLLFLFSIDSSGLCANSSLSVPGFGYDTLLGCSYIVQLDADCTTLRGIVQDHQRRLFTGDYVSRFGNPDNGTASGDWLNIVRYVCTIYTFMLPMSIISDL